MYGNLVDFRAYALERGDSAPGTASDVDATAALVRGSDHIRFRYVSKFLSDYDETADGVVEATYIAAGIELAKPGFFSKAFAPGEAKVLVQVKSIRWERLNRREGDVMISDLVPVSTAIDALLSRYLYSGPFVLVI